MFVRSRPVPFAFSLLTHGAILAWVASGPVRDRPKSLYQQVIAPHSTKLIWYNFKEKLPDVSPVSPRRSPEPHRAEFQSPREMVAGTVLAPGARQFIWQPAPKIELQQDLKSPNVLALRTPHIEPLPLPKAFVPPPQTPKPQPKIPALAAPPPIQTAAAPAPAPLTARLSRPEPRAFTPPPVKKTTPAVGPIEAPPEIQVARNLNAVGTIGNALGVRPGRPQPRAFVAPRAGQAAAGTTPALPAPPSVELARNSPLPSARAPLGGELAKPARRVLVVPGGTAKNGSSVVALAGPPALPAAPPSSVSMAIVGLHPTPATSVPVPDGYREGHFSMGPEQRAQGSDGGKVDGATLTVPGLMIHNPAKAPAGAASAKPVLVARAAPTSQQTLQAAIRERMAAPAAGGSRPAAVPVASSPDPLLAGRAIYAMTVQMPNVTSYSGSWMIWFAERGQGFNSAGNVSAPMPLRKVDPKYIPSAMADRVEGKVRLAAVIRKNGRVDSVQLLQRLDDRLDRSAVDAIDKWEFEPALRNGQPVEVDAVIEIPFHLAPQVPR